MEIKRRIRPDYSAYHVRKQFWLMKLLKFYRSIEFDDEVYLAFAKRIFEKKIDQKQLEQINKLMVEDQKRKKAKFEKRRKYTLQKMGGRIFR